jgi:hypothetical protein
MGTAHDLVGAGIGGSGGSTSRVEVGGVAELAVAFAGEAGPFELRVSVRVGVGADGISSVSDSPLHGDGAMVPCQDGARSLVDPRIETSSACANALQVG